MFLRRSIWTCQWAASNNRCVVRRPVAVCRSAARLLRVRRDVARVKVNFFRNAASDLEPICLLNMRLWHADSLNRTEQCTMAHDCGVLSDQNSHARSLALRADEYAARLCISELPDSNPPPAPLRLCMQKAAQLLRIEVAITISHIWNFLMKACLCPPGAALEYLAVHGGTKNNRNMHPRRFPPRLKYIFYPRAIFREIIETACTTYYR